MRREERLQQRGVPGHLTTEGCMNTFDMSTEFKRNWRPMLTVKMISAVCSHSNHAPLLANGPDVQEKNKYTRTRVVERHTKQIEYLIFLVSPLR